MIPFRIQRIPLELMKELKPRLVILVVFLVLVLGEYEKRIQAWDTVTWVQDSCEDFIADQFDSSGLNLYATRKGTIETVNRFDLNGDGYLDLASKPKLGALF